MRVYTLTELTRKIDENRRIIIQGVELRARLLKVLLIGLAPSALVAAFTAPVLGLYALFVFAAGEAAAYWLLEHRARRGLRLRTYQALIDRTRSQVGSFACCGVAFDPLEVSWEGVVASSVPLRRPDVDEAGEAWEPALTGTRRR